MQRVDVVSTLVHEATYEPVVTEDDAGHLGDVLIALVLGDVAAVIYQTGHYVAFTSLFNCAFFNLDREKKNVQGLIS